MRGFCNCSWTIALLLAAWSLTAPPVVAETSGATDLADAVGATNAEAEAASTEEVAIFERMMVTGGPERINDLPGSAHFIGTKELDEQKQDDVLRILRQVPGLNIQDEEGYGLRPNIGMRGSGTERSAKITLMEDGVLVAPAPYTAPSAYYFPTAGRMAAFEVMKGPASIRQGPFTTGGVLNMISSDFPGELGGRIDLAFGSENTGKLRATFGDTNERVSWLLETYQLQTDGFKTLDGGGDTGFELQDYLGKVRWTSRPGRDVYQALELKLGRTTQFGNETYLGLTDEDFEATPYRRYAASQEDWIDTDHDQYQLRYFLQPSERFDLTATVYRNDFFRNWHKLQSVAGADIARILGSPDEYANELAIVRGDADSDVGELMIRNNRREYYGQGVQAVAGLRLGEGAVRHSIEIGVRAHQDEEDRFQDDDAWQMIDGRVRLNGLGRPGSQSNRVSSANAIALFAQDRMAIGRWTIRPGLRLESIDYFRRDYGTNDPARTGDDLAVRENSVDAWIPGVGVDYLVNDQWMVFGGIHKGFAPPGAGRNDETKPEESINFETGFRFGNAATSTEVVGFFNDYSNLLGADTLSSGGEGTGDLFNGGEAKVWGLEASISTDLGPLFGRDSHFPARLSYTFTRGEFGTSFDSDYAPWGSVKAGDKLPYLPEHQLSGSIGLTREGWATYLSATYTEAMRTIAGQGPIPQNEATDDAFVLDLSGNVRLIGELRLDVQIRNLLDDAIIVSRRPAGVRPGLSRTVLIGLNLNF